MLRLYLIEFMTFGRCLLRYARYIRGVLFGLTVLVLSGGIALAYVEQMPLAHGESMNEQMDPVRERFVHD